MSSDNTCCFSDETGKCNNLLYYVVKDKAYCVEHYNLIKKNTCSLLKVIFVEVDNIKLGKFIEMVPKYYDIMEITLANNIVDMYINKKQLLPLFQSFLYFCSNSKYGVIEMSMSEENICLWMTEVNIHNC